MYINGLYLLVFMYNSYSSFQFRGQSFGSLFNYVHYRTDIKIPLYLYHASVSCIKKKQTMLYAADMLTSADFKAQTNETEGMNLQQ